MKRIYVSQRVDILADYGERRDALDQCWAHFLRETGALPFPLPNNLESAPDMLRTAPPDGILLTGGNSPAEYGGNAPERDAMDALLLEYAVKHSIPLIGVCRGMQSVLLHFGGSLQKVENHVAVRHMVSGHVNRTVNSYHSLAVDAVPPDITVLASSGDGVVEAVRHTSLPILAMMWHPEREAVFADDDVNMFRGFWFGKAETI